MDLKKIIINKSKKVLQKSSNSISVAADFVTEKSKKAWDKTPEVVSKIADSTAELSIKAWEQAVDSTKIFVKKGKSIFKDDMEEIRNECALLNKWTETSVPHAVFNSAILAAVEIGVLSNEDNLIHLTKVMDSEGTIFEKILEKFFDEQEIEQISKWIDTVPESSYAGGGIIHRVQHGHDINALIELIKNHDLSGVAEWFNHIALQDFWTPAGIPYLPSGSDTVYDWLCSLGLGKELAADLLSINCVEVMAILLLYRTSKSFYKFINGIIKEKRAKELWDRAIELEELEDFSAANHCYDQVLSYVPEKPEVAIGTAMNFLHCAQHQNTKEMWKSNMFRAYQIADSVRLKLTKDKRIHYEGIKLSLRGLATTIMASSLMSMAAKDNIVAIKGFVASGVEDFIRIANSLKNKLKFRPFSAIANESMALNLLIATPFALPTVHTPLTIHKRITDTLQTLSLEESNEGKYAKKLLVGFNKKYPLIETE